MCENCGWADAIDKIDDMLNDKKYTYANDFMTSVKAWVEKNEHITDKQKNALNNVVKGSRRNG